MPHGPVSVLVPCRAGSKRVPKKNTRPFAGDPGGLIERKLKQLDAAELVDTIIVSTDDPVVMEVAERCQPASRTPIEIIERPPQFAIDDTLDAFLAYVPTIMPEGVTAWTHVTSPFFGAKEMDHAIATYREKVEQGPFDSLMTVNVIRSFLWSEDGCVTHDRSKVKWPQSQDLPVFYEANSALFLMRQADMAEREDRIGDKPYLLETGFLQSFDIDWPDDFDVAEVLAKAI